MCIIHLFVRPNHSDHPYDVIVASNRDEFYRRPTRKASFWDGDARIIGGVDMEPGREGGTWLGLNKSGRLGALLNIPVPQGQPQRNPRGQIVSHYLKEKAVPVSTYLDGLRAGDYTPFNFVSLSRDSGAWKGHYFTNWNGEGSECRHSPEETCQDFTWTSGTLCFGNSPGCRPWSKVSVSLKSFDSIVSSAVSGEKEATEESLVHDLTGLLSDRTSHWPCAVLQDQRPDAVSSPLLPELARVQVNIPEIGYGTRTNTIILIDRKGQCMFTERTLVLPVNPSPSDLRFEDRIWTSQSLHFQLDGYQR